MWQAFGRGNLQDPVIGWEAKINFKGLNQGGGWWCPSRTQEREKEELVWGWGGEAASEHGELEVLSGGRMELPEDMAET